LPITLRIASSIYLFVSYHDFVFRKFEILPQNRP
jgi:hypothetical protein